MENFVCLPWPIMVSKLSISRIAGLMMGMWFLSSSLAGYVSGLIAGIMSVPGSQAGRSARNFTRDLYAKFQL